jgi:hypothetical protein
MEILNSNTDLLISYPVEIGDFFGFNNFEGILRILGEYGFEI